MGATSVSGAPGVSPLGVSHQGPDLAVCTGDIAL